MELQQAIEKRHTVRRFTAQEISPEILRELVRRAGMAPSINNAQSWKFIVVTNKPLIAELSACVHKRIHQLFSDTGKENLLKTVDHFSTVFEQAPAVIFVATQPYKALADDLHSVTISHEALNEMRRHPDLQSVGAAVQNLLLSAVDLNLGSCWLSGLMVARIELEKLLHIEKPWELITAVAIGQPAGEAKAKERKPVEEILELIA